MLFRKRIAVSEFADMLISLHSQQFSHKAFLLLAKQSGLSMDDSSLANALVEWLIFGIFLVRNSVTGNCKGDLQLRDSILNAFFDKLYTGLAKAGFRKEEFPEFEEEIRLRFREYDSAMSSADSNSVLRLGLAAANNIFGQDVLEEGDSTPRFAMLAVAHFADAAVPFGKLFRDFKVMV